MLWSDHTEPASLWLRTLCKVSLNIFRMKRALYKCGIHSYFVKVRFVLSDHGANWTPINIVITTYILQLFKAVHFYIQLFRLGVFSWYQIFNSVHLRSQDFKFVSTDLREPFFPATIKYKSVLHINLNRIIIKP